MIIASVAQTAAAAIHDAMWSARRSAVKARTMQRHLCQDSLEWLKG
jgi:hypothetical protein